MVCGIFAQLDFDDGKSKDQVSYKRLKCTYVCFKLNKKTRFSLKIRARLAGLALSPKNVYVLKDTNGLMRLMTWTKVESFILRTLDISVKYVELYSSNEKSNMITQRLIHRFELFAPNSLQLNLPQPFACTLLKIFQKTKTVSNSIYCRVESRKSKVEIEIGIGIFNIRRSVKRNIL